MGVLKVLGVIFLILIIILGVIGVDIYLTYSSLSQTNLKEDVSSPTYSISNDNTTVTISVNVTLPSGGFIPKGVLVSLTLDIGGNLQTRETSLNLGEHKTINLEYTIPDAAITTLEAGGSVLVKLSALVTPTIFSFEIGQLQQKIDLGSQTISL